MAAAAGMMIQGSGFTINPDSGQLAVGGKTITLTDPGAVDQAKASLTPQQFIQLVALMGSLSFKLAGNTFVPDDRFGREQKAIMPQQAPVTEAGLLNEGRESGYLASLSGERRSELQGMGRAFAAGPSPALMARWGNFVSELSAKGGPMDVNELVQAVLKEAYQSNTEDLRFFYEKVRYFNDCKKAIREHCNKMRAFSAQMKSEALKLGIITDPAELLKLNRPQNDSEKTKQPPPYPGIGETETIKDYMARRYGELVQKNGSVDVPPPEGRIAPPGMATNVDSWVIAAGAPIPPDMCKWLMQSTWEDPKVQAAFNGNEALYNQTVASMNAHGRGQHEIDMGMPRSIPGPGYDSPEKIEEAIKHWEEKLSSVGDDAQLANVELQNCLQKQQQTLQMLSNISKMLHDTAMAVIRKIGG